MVGGAQSICKTHLPGSVPSHHLVRPDVQSQSLGTILGPMLLLCPPLPLFQILPQALVGASFTCPLSKLGRSHLLIGWTSMETQYLVGGSLGSQVWDYHPPGPTPYAKHDAGPHPMSFPASLSPPGAW